MAHRPDKKRTSNKAENNQIASKGWRNWGDHPIVVLIATIAGVVTIILSFTQLVPLFQNPGVRTPDKKVPTSTIEHPSVTPTDMVFAHSSRYILFNDDFSDPLSGWSNLGETYTTRYKNGWYGIIWEKDYVDQESNVGFFATREKFDDLDGDLGIEVTIIGPFDTDGPKSGVSFGIDKDTHDLFAFAVGRGGFCDLVRVKKDGSTWGSSKKRELIDSGHVLKFDDKSSSAVVDVHIQDYRRIEGYINGQLCINHVVDDFVPGLVGVYAYDSNPIDAAFYFDEFSVSRPNQ